MKLSLNIIISLIFTISSVLGQSVTVVSPNGGENWDANSTQTIKWKCENLKEIKIEYSLDNGLSWGTIVQSVDALAGEYKWTAADVKTPYVLIKISDASNPMEYDISDKNFSLTITKEKERINKLAGNPVRIMLLGDSITRGTNPDDYNSPGYRRILDSLLTNGGYNFDFVGSLNEGEPDDFDRDHEGQGGWNAYSPSISISLLNFLNEFLSDNPPDIILLHIGTNDLSSSNSSAELAIEVKNLLDTIYTFDSSIVTIVAKIVDRADTETRHNKTIDFNINELPDMINSLPAARQEKTILADVYNDLGLYYSPPAFLNSNFTYLEGSNLHLLHPNTNGYYEMADVWYTALIDIIGNINGTEVEVETAPDQFELYQNYPNPFNPETNIKFNLPQISRVILDIYNIIGEHVIRLIDQELEPGFYNLNFDVGNLPDDKAGLSSGTYIYRIQTKDFSQARKMLLLK